MADPLAELAAEAVAQDADLRKRIGRFVDNVLYQAEYLMANGNPKQQGDLISKLIPHLVKQMTEQAEDESLAKMRAEMTAMFEEMRAAGLTPNPTPPQPDIPVDAPSIPDVIAQAAATEPEEKKARANAKRKATATANAEAREKKANADTTTRIRVKKS